MLVLPPDMEGYLALLLPPPYLALPAVTHFGEWLYLSWGFTICQHQQTLTSLPPPDICVPSNVYCHITLPKVFTHLQWTLQQMSMVKAVTSS